MIVSCPQCTSRYKIRDDKIQGAGARITCPSCTHKFVVYRESSKLVVGGNEQPKGLPVTFARKGQLQRAAVPEEEDEDDAPTTLMPHGSSLADQIRATVDEERRRMMAEERSIAPAATPGQRGSAAKSGAADGSSRPKFLGPLLGFTVVGAGAIAIAYALQLFP